MFYKILKMTVKIHYIYKYTCTSFTEWFSVVILRFSMDSASLAVNYISVTLDQNHHS